MDRANRGIARIFRADPSAALGMTVVSRRECSAKSAFTAAVTRLDEEAAHKKCARLKGIKLQNLQRNLKFIFGVVAGEGYYSREAGGG